MEASDDTGSVRSATHCSAEEVDNSRQCAHQQNPLNEELAETVAPTGEITCSSSTASDCIQQRPTAPDNCYAFWPDSLSLSFRPSFRGFLQDYSGDFFRTCFGGSFQILSGFFGMIWRFDRDLLEKKWMINEEMSNIPHSRWNGPLSRKNRKSGRVWWCRRRSRSHWPEVESRNRQPPSKALPKSASRKRRRRKPNELRATERKWPNASIRLRNHPHWSIPTPLPSRAKHAMVIRRKQIHCQFSRKRRKLPIKWTPSSWMMDVFPVVLRWPRCCPWSTLMTSSTTSPMGTTLIG